MQPRRGKQLRRSGIRQLRRSGMEQLRRSDILIAIGVQVAFSSVGASYKGFHAAFDLDQKPDVAPTELTAIGASMAIKILLLRSIVFPMQMSLTHVVLVPRPGEGTAPRDRSRRSRSLPLVPSRCHTPPFLDRPLRRHHSLHCINYLRHRNPLHTTEVDGTLP